MSDARRPLSEDDAGERLAWAIEPFRCFAQFYGRAPRKEYWMSWGLTWGLSLVAWGLDKLLHIDNTLGPTGPFSDLVTLIVFVPTIALAVRRLHDVGYSGWWLLLVFLPILGWVALIAMLAKRGNKGRNRFGPDPAETAR